MIATSLVSTPKFSMISEEIARQLENSGAKYILTIGLFYENIKAACEIYPGIQKIIVLGMDEKPEECLSFIEMMIYDDGSLYDQDRYFFLRGIFGTY